ncbi:MAG: hypothetical protein M1299_08175, partial [Firmicutes bacterium]|nr:hypothetical protein [Bacillota bacterium]
PPQPQAIWNQRETATSDPLCNKNILRKSKSSYLFFEKFFAKDRPGAGDLSLHVEYYARKQY